MMARGRVRCGSLTSSPAVETASRPMNEKKIVPAAAVMPADPRAQKLSNRSASKAVNPMTMNSPSTESLISTMIAVDPRRLAGAADQQQRAEDHQDDGRQVDQPGRAAIEGKGEYDSASGRVTPSVLSSSSLK